MSDFDARDLLRHGREYPAEQATRTSYLLAETEERCKLQKGIHQLLNLLQSKNMWYVTVKLVKNNF